MSIPPMYQPAPNPEDALPASLRPGPAIQPSGERRRSGPHPLLSMNWVQSLAPAKEPMRRLSSGPPSIPMTPLRAGGGPARLAIALVVVALAALGFAATAAARGTSRKPGEITVLLQLRHPRGLAKFVRSVSDPRSPHYREYATVEQLVHRFGAKLADRRAALRWLAEHGAQGALGPTGTYITARLPAAAGSRALPPAGASASSTGAVSSARRVPAKLRGHVTGVGLIGTEEGAFGTNVETAAGKHLGQEPGLKGTSIVFNTGTTAGCAAARHAGEPEPLNGYTPNQYLDAYGGAALQKSGYKGQGKDIAVIEIDGFRRSDVDTFARCFGLPSPNLRVRPVGISKPLPPGNETTLDLEVLTATAPKAEHIYVYEGGSSEYRILNTVAAALGSKGHRPDAISISLGGCEPYLLGQLAFRDAMNELFAVADGAGISVLVAAGDQGSSSCRIENEEGESALPLISASDPASSPYVTGVGGTNVELTKSNRIKREMVWNDSPLAFGGGGGAPSILTVPRPWWQRGILSRYGNGRIVPDVSGLADVVPGYAIYCTAPECKSPEQPGGGWETVGGTSAATPLYAGGVILADGYQAKRGAPPLGFLDPLLYEVGREAKAGVPAAQGVLLDVTRGNNDLGVLTPVDAGGGAPLGCCSAGVGYDAASGWGSLDLPGLAHVALSRFEQR
jgi:pro-kumamolisin-like protein/subtilase family protein